MEQELDGGKSPVSKGTEIFETEWRIYKKLVDHNYLFHNEVYSCLREMLIKLQSPFRFLDIACGDAYGSVKALRGTLVSHYTGIDSSQVALDLAAEALVGLSCEVEL
jgi:ubiquinone/menaquinone biosynthesis C-methylase UbiE